MSGDKAQRAWRTRSSPLGPLARLGVRRGLDCGVFSLVRGLPSTASAGDGSPLFGRFAGTMPRFDSPPPCMRDVPLIAFSLRPAPQGTGDDGVSRFSRKEFLCMLGVFDSAGRRHARDIA